MSILYRATLDGSPAVDVRLRSVTVRRNTSGETVTLVAPIRAAGDIDAILARFGNDLQLDRVIVATDGGETVQNICTCPMTGVRGDRGGTSSSVTLTGSHSPIWTPGTVSVSDISYRATFLGARRVRGAINLDCVPGDTATLPGDETLTVGEVVFSVSGTSETMEIQEA